VFHCYLCTRKSLKNFYQTFKNIQTFENRFFVNLGFPALLGRKESQFINVRSLRELVNEDCNTAVWLSWQRRWLRAKETEISAEASLVLWF